MKQFKIAFASILCLQFFAQTAGAFDIGKMTENERKNNYFRYTFVVRK